jgi:hypothetical protein
MEVAYNDTDSTRDSPVAPRSATLRYRKFLHRQSLEVWSTVQVVDWFYRNEVVCRGP